MINRVTSSLAVLLLTLAAVSLSGSAWALVQFSEDWESEEIDPAKWNMLGAGGPFVFNLADTGQSIGGATDYALFLAGSGLNTGALASVASFDRGDDLRVTFKLMKDDVSLNSAGICGPWANISDLRAGDYPALYDIEAGFQRTSGNFLLTSEFDEGMFATPWTAGDSAFYDAVLAATHKSTVVTVRVTLGDTTGARVEWSADGVNFDTVVHQECIWEGSLSPTGNTMDFDSVGMTAGDTWFGTNRVSSATTVWLRFGGGTYGGRFIIDDIVVETGSLAVGDWYRY